jgi:hypothetical protein
MHRPKLQRFSRELVEIELLLKKTQLEEKYLKSDVRYRVAVRAAFFTKVVRKKKETFSADVVLLIQHANTLFKY